MTCHARDPILVWVSGEVALRRSVTGSLAAGGFTMVQIVVIVLVVLFVAGYFGRGRFRA